MKAQLSKLTAFLLFFAFILTACSKDDIFQNPIPNPGGPGRPTDIGMFRFAVAVDLTGEPYHSSNLAAVVSIVNEKNDTVVNERLLTLNLNSMVTTEMVKLPAGAYKLTRFRLVYGSVNTHFATPVTNSAKAAQVQKPLPMAFTVVANSNADVPVEVIRVQKGELPALFGYPSGAFDNGQSDADPYMKVKIRAMIQIGKVLYDSIPASLRLTTWNSNGEMNTTYTSLKGGTNEVAVLKSATRFQFQVSRWGITDEITLDRQNVDEDSVYTLGGTKEAKLLKAEITSRLVDGVYKAEYKNEYIYDAANKLSKINYYLKRKDNSPYLAMTDVFEYSGATVQKITRYDEANKAIGVTSFAYDAQGRVHSIAQNDNGHQTVASVEYTHYTYPQVTIHYTYPGQIHTMDYTMTFLRGNMIEGNALTSGQSSEMGKYDHDTEINPYVHMNWPNLFLSNSSKNNVTAEYKTYHGNHPTAVPYNFKYSYDGDGYPKELIKQFQSYGDYNYMYTTKTVYVY